MANTQIKLDRIHQGGASNGQIMTWVTANNAWTPQNPGAGADGNGIYSGSGTIGNGVSSSTTNATLPTSAAINFRYQGGNSGITLDDAGGTLQFRNKTTGQSFINLTSANNNFGWNNNILQADTNGLSANTSLFVDDIGSTRQASALLEVLSTTKGFLPPRLTTLQRDAIASPANGLVIYNSTTHKFTVRQNSAWVEMETSGSNNGIYSGSGTVPTNVEATLTDYFAFNYASTNPALEITSSAGEVRLTSDNTSGSILTNNTNSKVFFDSKGLTIDTSKSVFNNRVEFADTIGLTSTISPTQITANQNDYAPSGNTLATTWRISSDAARNITGLASPSDGRVIVLHNIGSFTITLKNQDTNSLIANRFRLVADLPLGAGMSATFEYDNTAGALGWRCIGIGSTYVTAGQGGIYAGSGTIANACVATLTSSSSFNIKYSNANPALVADDTAGTIKLQFKTTSGAPAAAIQVNSGQIFMYTGSSTQNTLIIDKATAKTTFTNADVYVSTLTGTGTAGQNSGLEVDSTNRVFYPPRMTTTQRDAISTAGVDNGAVLYNSSTGKFTVRQAGVWAEMQAGGDGNGIYSGSGTIGAGVAASSTVATLPTSTSGFKINYSAGTAALDISNANQTVIAGPGASGATLTATATDISMGSGTKSLTVGSSNLAASGTMIITGPGGSGSIDGSALLDLDATNKILYVPRISAANQTTIGAANNGGFHYNTTTNKFTFRQGGAWVELGSVIGGIELSSITAATTLNTIDNAANAQTWNWSTLTTGTGGMLFNANALTTGSLITIATSNNSVNSTNGLFYVNNSGTSTNGILAGFRANSTAGTGLYVMTGNKVGVGTNAPAVMFHVAGHGRFDGAVLSRGSGANSSDISSSIRLTNTSGDTWYITSKDNSGLDIQSGSLGTIIGIAPTNGMVTTSASVAYPIVQTPASISATQNNYTVDNGVYAMRVTPTANLSITGFAPSAGSHVGGRRFVFYNIDASNTFIITFKHQDTNSIAGNRIITSNGADITCRGGGSVVFWYDAVDSRWRVESAA